MITMNLREIDRQILQLQEEISRALGPEHQDVLSQYECLANSRMTKELDHAFLIGYQTAIRLLLMGVLPLPALVADNSTGEENGGATTIKPDWLSTTFSVRGRAAIRMVSTDTAVWNWNLICP